MLTLHTWKTPNGRKPAILLEELGLPYELRPVDLSRKEQFASDFLKISPNNKIPALVDDEAEGDNGEPLSLFESGAILTYLAEKHGRFLAPAGPARYRALEWLHWQVGGLGPMLGQLGFFAVRSKEKLPPAIRHFTEEADRLLGVLDGRVSEAPFLAGDDYTIADIAAYPWAVAATTILAEVLAQSLETKSSLHRWMERIRERPAVARGMDILSTD